MSHAHPVDPVGVERAVGDLIAVEDAEDLVGLLRLLSDPVRLRILFALVAVEELCVGDLALALGISMDQSSYALKQLRAASLVQSRRDGRVMYYRLPPEFPTALLDHCLRQLQTIAGKDGAR